MKGLLLALLIIPTAEIDVFIWAGGIIGPWWVVFLILLTGFVGVSLAKKEGVETMRRAQITMNYGQIPTREIVDGICIFIGGVLLLSPGFITDVTGIITVLPWTRELIKPIVGKLLKRVMKPNSITYRR